MWVPGSKAWRCVTSFLKLPVDGSDVPVAKKLISDIFNYNLRCEMVTKPHDYIVVRGEGKDIGMRVYRWDTRSYKEIFEHGFKVRDQGTTPIEKYYNLETYVNKGERSLDKKRLNNYGFVSTSLSPEWYPRILSDRGKCTYLYEINAPGGIHIPKTLGHRYQHPVRSSFHMLLPENTFDPPNVSS